MADISTTIPNASETDSDPEAMARRDFLKNVGKAAATAPAVALLLAAGTKAASAQVNDTYGGGGGCGCGET